MTRRDRILQRIQKALDRRPWIEEETDMPSLVVVVNFDRRNEPGKVQLRPFLESEDGAISKDKLMR